MPRLVARFFFVFLLGLVALVLGVVSAMTLTPPGRDLLARSVSELLDRIVLGRVDVGAISGSFLYDLTLERLVVRDTAGALLADLPRVRVSYRIPNFIAGSAVLSSIELDRPIIQLIKHRNGRMNYEEVLGIGKGAPGGKSPLVDFHDVRIEDGTLRIALPWNPPPRLRTQAERDSALRAERLKPGRIIEPSPEGYRRVILLQDLTTRMGRLRISTPDRLPFMIDLDSLATRVNDPAITLRNAVGRARIRGDSVVFSLARGALPDTRFSGGGAVTWPRDTILFDFQVVAPRVNLDDLRWVSPQFPAMVGSAVLTAKSTSGAVTEYDLRELELRGGPQRIEGDLVAITDKRRPALGVRDMRLGFRDLDLDAARAYLDTLPFYGTITGTAKGGGWLDDLDVDADFTFADAKVPGRPVTAIAARGGIQVREAEGLVFRQVDVRRSDIDLGTVRRLAPAVILLGRLQAVGTLDGPLRDATFDGTLVHQDAARPPSIVEGRLHLDTRFDTLGLETDVVLAPLSFEGIRRAFPSLTARGDLRGRFASAGTLAHLTVDADLTGELGAVAAQGRVTILPPRWGADSLRLQFSRLDLSVLNGGRSPATQLAGALQVSGVVDTLQAPEGNLLVALSRSRIREFTLDTLFAAGAMRDSVIRLDTAYAIWKGASASGSGTLGWVRPHEGTMRFAIAVDSLVAFDSLLLATTGLEREPTDSAAPLGGSARGAVTLSGSLDTLGIAASAEVHDLAFNEYRAPAATGTVTYVGGDRPRITASVSTDSLAIGSYALRRVGARAVGFTDSLAWGAGMGIGPDARIDGAGEWWRRGDATYVALDSLLARLTVRNWRLRQPTTITLSDSAPAVTPATLTTDDGSGAIQIQGRIPGEVPGDLTVDATGISLQEVYAAMLRDTTGFDGAIDLAVELGGTAADPNLRGTVSLADGRFGEFKAPFVEGVINYADSLLQANVSLWRTGANVLQADARLPVDLALRGARQRQLDGPIAIRAHTDSVDLGLVEALTDAVTSVTGILRGEVQVGGTWDQPKLGGGFQVQDGAMTVPGLGVRWTGLRGAADLRGDSLLLRDVSLASAEGTLGASGTMRLEELSHPILDVALDASRFRAIDVRDFLTLGVTGRVRLTGPIIGATLTGSATASEGVLYFADLLAKQIIDLDDPTVADLVDTTLIRRENLGATFQNRFLDSLKVQNFRLEMGEQVWLRSNEANIQLEGNLLISKVGREYVPDGTLNAVRGTYTLKIGPVSRDFTVQRGVVRYYGTPDLNPTLDIEARHVVRGARGEEVPIIARITGTLYQPRLSLETTPGLPLTETDLASYLITGYPANEAAALGQASAVQGAVAILGSAISSEVERFLISDLGIPVDLIEFRPGVVSAFGAQSISRFAAGWQLGRKTFVTLNAGFCDIGQFTYENLGAGIEFRFSREWKLVASTEPNYQSCFTTTSRVSGYQFGGDLQWEWEY